MVNRYNSSEIFNKAKKTEMDGSIKHVRRVSSTYYPDFNTENDVFIISQEGDRLDLLANEYYGDETLWFVIARANNIGHGSIVIEPGKVIRIPSYNEFSGIQGLLSSFNNGNA
jgi:nucleoid-associated protein YgaU